jgi:hypothetical protein
MRPWIAAAITVAAVVSLGYVHPFGNPRAEPAEGLGTLPAGREHAGECEGCAGAEVRGLPLE